MPILNSIISLVNSSRLSQIEDYATRGDAIQQEQLLSLLKVARNTEYGQQLKFNSIWSEIEFQQRVPVVDYEGVRTYVDRLREGEKNVLWPGEIKWFAKSSGTTSTKSKFIPVSKESLENCHFRGGKDVISLYLRNFPDTELLSGKCLTLGGSHQINSFSNDSYYGDLSAILIENSPFWSNFIRTPAQNIALIENWEEKLEKITQATLSENVTSLAGVPSWFLILLKHILKHTGKSSLKEVWPNLELFIHGGINFTPYREQYSAIIPGAMHYMETFNASEGFFAIQDVPGEEGMLLMLDYGIYYEFVPLSEVGNPFPKAYTLSQVQVGVDYAMVITTNGGLWRYLIGDTVRFTSLSPFRVVVSGRTKHYINAFGEELMIDNADRALQKACEATGAIVTEYTAAPVFISSQTQGHHQWLIEFERDPDQPTRFVEVLDETLKQLNSDYEAKRYKSITLIQPVVIRARQNLFIDWMRMRNKLGGQNKVPRLSNTREYMDELLKLNE